MVVPVLVLVRTEFRATLPTVLMACSFVDVALTETPFIAPPLVAGEKPYAPAARLHVCASGVEVTTVPLTNLSCPPSLRDKRSPMQTLLLLSVMFALEATLIEVAPAEMLLGATSAPTVAVINAGYDVASAVEYM